MRRLAYGLLGDEARMEDVLQEAYLKAFAALPRFRGDADFATWLHRIVRNACIDELRRLRRERAVAGGRELEEERSLVADPGLAVDEASALRAALMELPEEERATVWLVDAEGLDYRAAAAALDVPPGTVGSRLNRARASLRAVLKKERDSR